MLAVVPFILSAFLAGMPVAVSQSTTSTSATAATSSTRPALVFPAPQTLVACQPGKIFWAYQGGNASAYTVSLYAINIGVDQTVSSPSAAAAAPSSSSLTSSSTTTTTSRPLTSLSTSALGTSRAVLPRGQGSESYDYDHALTKRADFNLTLTTSQPANVAFTWSPVSLPQGRYYFQGVVNDVWRTTARSPIFTIITTSNTSCLVRSPGSSTSSSFKPYYSSIPPSSSSKPAAAATAGSTGAPGVSGGAIAGIVIGVVAIIGLGLLLAFCLVRRRKRRTSRLGDGRAISGPSMIQHHRQSGLGVGVGSGSGPFAPLPSAATSQGDHGEGAHGAYAMTEIKSDDSGHGYGNGNEKEISGSASGSDATHESDLDPDDARLATLGKYARAPNTPQPPNTAHQYQNIGVSEFGRAPTISRDTRRQSGPPAFNTTPPGSGTGTGTATPRKGSGSGGPGEIGRTSSTRRKPVPSLGPELRGELEGAKGMGVERSRSVSERSMTKRQGRIGLQQHNPDNAGAGQEGRRYSLIPDPPRPPQ